MSSGTTMHLFVIQPRPLLTGRIAFSKPSYRYSPYPRPLITSRIDFGLEERISAAEELTTPSEKPNSRQTVSNRPATRRSPSEFSDLTEVPSEGVPDSVQDDPRRSPRYDDDDEDYEDQLQGDSSVFPDPRNSTVAISKPNGEAGRPGRGGYCLKTALTGWTSEEYAAVKSAVGAYCKEHRFRGSYNKQNEDKIQAACEFIRKKYPILAKYKGDWPIHDMLKSSLKSNSNSKAKPVTRQ